MPHPPLPPASPITHLLYLHGFRSSPQSAKARLMAAHMAAEHPAVHWWCPQLPPSPREAMAQVMAGIAGWPQDRMAVIGSSLGGFYAAWVAGQTGCRYALLNPAVNPARDLARYIGEQQSWHAPDESFYFEPVFVDELQTLAAGPRPQPAFGYALIAKGDEVLDWREMAERHAGCQIKLLEGGDHALSDFALHMTALLDFLGL
jgi:predicted esterase YcpF (UPF0227 family)